MTEEIRIQDLCRTIDLKGLGALKTFTRIGYRFRPQRNDFFRKDTNGRFHIKPTRQGWMVHYDFFGNGGKHISNIPMTSHLDREQQRIQQHITQHGTSN